MARKTAETRAWFMATSPRSPYKLPGTLRLLLPFDGGRWDNAAQLRYAELLKESETYEGEVSAGHTAFAARDRINRAPQMLGFVRLSSVGKTKVLHITDAGKRLSNGEQLEDLFLRQLLKWQFPSPAHDGAQYQDNFCIKPFLEALRLIRDADGLSKSELALFGLTLTKFKHYSRQKAALLRYREELNAAEGQLGKKQARAEYAARWLRRIYQDDIRQGHTVIREGGKGFIETKWRNLRDYADAAFRYFQATGLFSISAKGYRLRIQPDRLPEANQLLAETKREPKAFSDHDTFYAHFGNPDAPRLPGEDLAVLKERLTFCRTKTPDRLFPRTLEIEKRRDNEGDAIFYLKRVLADWMSLLEENARDEQCDLLKTYSEFDDVMSVFDQISNTRSAEIPDKPLFFEWNTWRALLMLDDGEIRNKFKIDTSGQPVSIAPGKTADIECVYSDFHLGVEVTLQSGHRQWETEGEPVMRHIGVMQQQAHDNDDKRDVFGLFLAPQLNPTAVNFFFTAANMRSDVYRGKVKVIPLELAAFQQMVRNAKNKGGCTSRDLYNFFLACQEFHRQASDEVQWMKSIKDLALGWAPVRCT